MRFVLILFMTVISVLANVATAAEKVLVFGGTGKLGAYIVADLINAGDAVTVFARSTSDRSRLKGLDVNYAIGNLDNGNEIASAIESGKFTVLIDASGRRADVFSYDHGQAMQQIVKSSEKSGVRQIIFISSVGAGDNIKNFPDIKWGEYTSFLQERGRAESAVFKGQVPYTIIRTGGLVIDGDAPATGKGKLVEDQTALGMITRRDLALLVVDCVAKLACISKVFHATDDSLKLPGEAKL